MKLKNLKNNLHGVIDLGVILMIGIAFVALIVVSYIMYSVGSSLGATGDAANTIANISAGFDNAITLILVAITIFILAIAISALLILRGGR